MSSRTPPGYDEPPDRSDTEATAFLPEMDDAYPDLPGASDVPPLPDGPPPMPADPLDRPHTREHFAISTIDESDEPDQAASVNNERLRQPAPRRKRPTLGVISPRPQPRSSNDSVMQPIRARGDASRPGLSSQKQESSDVMSTFDSSDMDSRPEPMTAAHQPIPSGRNKLVRKSAQARRPPAPRRPAPRPPRPPAAAVQTNSSAANVLPLSPESLSMLIADQRRRLHVLDAFARGLEISAGVLGTLSLAVLIAALVSIIVGTDVSVLNASSALVSAAASLGLTLLMVVGSISLRQLAHVSAQLAALLEALANRR